MQFLVCSILAFAFLKVTNAIVTEAIAHISGENDLTGVVHIMQELPGLPVNITVRITGIKDGLHAIHIHQYGILDGDCDTVGGHYNPFNMKHGGPDSAIRHVGDLGNVAAGAGEANYQRIDHLIKLNGPFSVVGRAVVIHTHEDTKDKPGSQGGVKMMCGNIVIRKEK